MNSESLFKFGEFENVSLTPAELAKLTERFGEKPAMDMIGALSEWKKSKGKKTKSDYATILQWFRWRTEGGGNYGARPANGNGGGNSKPSPSTTRVGPRTYTPKQ